MEPFIMSRVSAKLVVAAALWALGALAGCTCARVGVPVGPAITVSPAGAPAGATVQLLVTGTAGDGGTAFAAGVTTLSFDGVDVPSVDVQGPAQLTAVVTIAPDHLPGAVIVAVQNAVAPNGDQPTTLTTTFNVLGGDLVASISIVPSYGTAGTDLPLTVYGENTHFLDGVTTAAFDHPLVAITSPVTVRSETELTFDVSLDAMLPNGFATLTVQTGDEIAVGAFGLINPTQLGTIAVTPDRVARGARGVPLQIDGTDITFSTGMPTTVVEFSTPGITVRTLNVSAANRLNLVIDVAPGAAVGDALVLAYTGPSKAATVFSVDDRVVAGAAAAGAPAPPGRDATFALTTAGPPLGAGAPAVELTPGGGLDAASLIVGSPTTGTLAVTTSRGAPAGPAAFALYDPASGERLYGAVPIAPAGPPEIPDVAPVSVAPGAAASLALSGDGTSFAAGVTTAEILPLGAALAGEVVPGTLTVTGPTSATLDVVADGLATPGPAVVRLTTGSEVAEAIVLVGAAPAAALVPAAVSQGRAVAAELVADGVDLTSPALAVTAVSPDVMVESFAPLGPGRARVTLRAAAGALPGPATLLLDDGGPSPLAADFDVTAGTPTVTLPVPSTVRPGDELAPVLVVGRFTAFGAATSATVAGLVSGLFVEQVVASPGATPAADDVATVSITTSVLTPPGDYGLVIGTGAEAVATTLTVAPVVLNPLALPPPGLESTFAGSVAGGGAAYYAFTAAPGQVVTFVADAAFSPLDPALRLYAADGVTVLAGNDDVDDTITLSAEVTWAFAAAGTYYLRLEAETPAGGAFTLRARTVDAPVAEVEPNDDPAGATPLGVDPLGGPLAGAVVARGLISPPAAPGETPDVDYWAFTVGDGMDPADPLSVIVIDTAARGLVDHFGAVPDLAFEVLDATGAPVMITAPTAADDRAAPTGHLFDPVLAFRPPAPGTYVVKVTSFAGTTGPYLLNVRGPVVINEIFYNPQGASGAGTFIELAGVAGLAAAGVGLFVRARDCAGTVDMVAGIDAATLAAAVVPADGFYVVGADATVANWDLLVPETSVDFSEADGTTIELVVDAGGGMTRVVDAVHFAAAPAACTGGEGGFAPNPLDAADTSIGRAFGFDGDDNARDFRAQLRPSPGQANATSL
jgi:hypothetical protein